MTLLVGIIGCGAIARGAHLPLLAKLRSAKVVALADEDADALGRAGFIAPGAKRFSSADALMESHLPNAVLICTPASSHAPVAVAAFAGGLHVYLEKPIAATLSDADRIVEAWKHSGKVGCIGFNYRFNPLYVRLRAALNEPRVGSITHITTTFRVPRPSSSWRNTRAAGGGALLELGSHHIDMIRFLTGDEIQSVDAIIESRQSEHDYASLNLVTRDGTTASIVVEFGDIFDHTFRVDGTNGSAFIDIASSFEVEYPKDGTARRSITVERLAYIYKKLRAPLREPSYFPALSAFASAAATQTPAFPDLADGYASLEVIDAAERSAQSGKPVTVRSS